MNINVICEKYIQQNVYFNNIYINIYLISLKKIYKNRKVVSNNLAYIKSEEQQIEISKFIYENVWFFLKKLNF